MAKINIVTDSGSDLSVELIRENNIHVVPLRVNFGAESYLDGVEMSSTELYERLVTEKELVSTTQPNPDDFEKVYKELTKDGDQVLSLHLSGGLSGTHQSATIAASLFPPDQIRVIDTKQASMGIGLIVLYAAQLVRQGLDLDAIYERIHQMAGQIRIYFVVDTLHYLQRNGRIGKAQALVGSFLQLKPILTLNEGIVETKAKVRGKGKAVKQMLQILENEVGQDPMWIAIVHANCEDEALNIAKEVKARCNCQKVHIALIGGTIGVHAGPGTVGMMFWKVSS